MKELIKEWVKLPYPQVGDTNPTVKIGVINVAEKSKEWMNVPLEEGYSSKNILDSLRREKKLAVMHLNRATNSICQKLYGKC